MGSNEGSQALYIEMEECALLFTGDIEGEGEDFRKGATDGVGSRR